MQRDFKTEKRMDCNCVCKEEEIPYGQLSGLQFKQFRCQPWQCICVLLHVHVLVKHWVVAINVRQTITCDGLTSHPVICGNTLRHFMQLTLTVRPMGRLTYGRNNKTGTRKSWSCFDCVHVFYMQFNNGIQKCVESVTAVTNAGSPSDFFQRSQFVGTNQQNHSLWERD